MDEPHTGGKNSEEIRVGNVADSDAIAIGHRATAVKASGDVRIVRRVIRTSGGAYINRIDNYYERRPLPVPRQAPTLPKYFQPRADLSDRVVSTLTNRKDSVVAIVGPEGIGKTTLAVEIATVLDKEFPDAVLWGNLSGQTGDLRDLLGAFLSSLDIDVYHMTTLDERVKTLRSVLTDRRALVILDNLNDPSLDPWQLLPARSQSCVLITTSNRDHADSITESVFLLPPFSHSQSRDLLLKIGGPEIGTLPTDLMDHILLEANGIPLLLVSIGLQARRLRQQGTDALLEWARNPCIHWNNVDSIFDNVLDGMTHQERMTLDIIGTLANQVITVPVIAAGIEVTLPIAQQLLEGIRNRSLIDRTEHGTFIAQKPVYDYLRRHILDSGIGSAELSRLVRYVVTRANQKPGEPHLHDLWLAHLRGLLAVCARNQDWNLIGEFRRIEDPPIVISKGSIRVFYKTNGFLAELDALSLHDAIVTESDLGLAKINSCNINGSLFSKVGMQGAQFNSCSFSGTHFVTADLRGAQFNDCSFHGLNLVETDMRATNFNACHFADYAFVDTQWGANAFTNCSGIEEGMVNPKRE